MIPLHAVQQAVDQNRLLYLQTRWPVWVWEFTGDVFTYRYTDQTAAALQVNPGEWDEMGPLVDRWVAAGRPTTPRGGLPDEYLGEDQ